MNGKKAWVSSIFDHEPCLTFSRETHPGTLNQFLDTG
jgi:hypothetical protein